METALQSEQNTTISTTVILHSVEFNGNKYLREQTVKNERFHYSPFPVVSSKVHWVSLTPEGFTGPIVSVKEAKKLEEEFNSVNPRYKPR